MAAGITFNRATWKYEYNGESFDTLEAAQAAQARGYNPATGQYGTTAQPTVSYTVPGTGQQIQGPAVVTTPGLIGDVGGGVGGGSLGSLARASGTTYNAEDERLRLAGIQAEKDRIAQQQGYDTSRAATADANARAAQDRMMAFIAPYLAGAPAGGAPAATASSGAGGDLATNAENAAFARAKDKTADLARSSLMTLRAAGAERGINVAGGTNPALTAAEGRVVSEANKPLADLTREQAIQSSQRAADVEDRNYTGNIALAGQKAQQIPSLLSLLKVGGLY